MSKKTIYEVHLDGDVHYWTLDRVVDHINSDRGPEWVPYEASDWKEGWSNFCEGDVLEYELTMTKDMEREKLLSRVLGHIVEDVRNDDLTAIDELIRKLDDKWLKGYLPEQIGDNPAYRQGYADGVAEVLNHVKRFGN